MEQTFYTMTWEEVFQRFSEVDYPENVVYGIPRGGMVVTAFFKKATVTHDPEEATMFIDDICDSGRTRDKWLEKYPDKKFFALVDRHRKPSDETLGWIIFPWEEQKDVDEDDYAIRLLEFYGKSYKDSNIEKLKTFIQGMEE